MTLTKPYEATFQVGDGETKDFPFYFDEVSENFIRVIIKRADGSIYYPTFSVDMELLRVVFGEDEITPTPDDVICIYRDTPAIQDTQFNTLQGYNAKALENILSKIVAMIQEMKANGFSTQILQGEPWSLDLIKPADDGASVQIDYQARVLKKGLYFKMSDGNLLASPDGVNFVQMPKSENVAEFRQHTDDKGNVHFEYRVGDKWFGLATSADIADAYTKTEVDNKFAVANAQIDANAGAIQKTREDFINADSEIHQILNSHADELTTLRGNQASLGDQVSGIEEKIPGSASATNQLATKADLKGVGGDFVKKSGDTMTGILTIQAEEDYDPSTPPVGGLSFKSNASPVGFTNRMRQVGNGFIAIEYLLNGKQYSNLVFGDQQIYIDNTENGTGNPVSLGTSGNPWDNVYAKKLNNGADITIPTEGGTLARLEDVANKQDKLTAGDNIIISNNVISATGAGGGAGFDIVVVQELPATGQKGIIYLLAKDGTAPDVYDEYVWITATQTFELIGSTKVDLSDYLPLSGGTITGPITLGMTGDSSGDVEEVDILKSPNETPLVIGKVGSSGRVLTLGVKSALVVYEELLPLADVGQSFSKVPRIYVEKINNGADLSIPTQGGSLIRAEDVAESVNTKDLTVGTDEGTINIGIVAGTATIATNNGLDIVAQTKFDTAPTTDDSTTWANASGVSLVRKAQVATAIADAVANIDALPDQSGNAGKVLTTDGSTASWQEAPASGTKVIIKRYN